MFTFQSIMFVSLGFLCALLLGFVVAPAFWARAVRLTTDRLRASLPFTEQEISADRDRLRAENAIRVHQLTAKIEQARLYDARQKVEINRRDGTINALQRRLQRIETEREGSENARRVLEATITQRVPEIEARLMEARQLLAKRDAEMKALHSDTGRTFRALDDAMQVNAQQRSEIDQLKASLARGSGARLQGAQPDDGAAEGVVRLDGKSNAARHGKKASVIPLPPVVANDVEGWEAPIKEDQATDSVPAESDKLKAKIEEQAAKIEALSGQLAAYEEAATSKGRSLSLRDTKSALKARIAASVKEIATRDKTIEDLRREIATANERTARQASYYQDELRRLGAGGGQTSASIRAESGVSEIAASSSAASENVPETAASAEGKADHGTAEKIEPAIKEPASKQSLEERLAAVEVESNEPVVDFDQHAEAADADPKQQRGKLMDRIAGLAKR